MESGMVAGKRLESGGDCPIFGGEPAISGRIPEEIRWKKDTTDAHRQAHHQVPAGPGRRPEPGTRPRWRVHRAPAPAAGAPRPAGRGRGLAPAARRRQRGVVAQGPRRGRGAAAEGGGTGRRDLGLPRPGKPPQPHRQGSGQARRPVHRLGALPAGGRPGQGRDRAPPQAAWRHRGRDRHGHQGRARRAGRREPGGRRQPRGAQEVHARPHGARAPGQARPRHRARRRDPAHDPDPAAPHQEQPGAHRRARRGQDRHRRGPRAAHRQRRGARDAQGQARALARHGGAARRGQVPRRVRGAPEVRPQGDRAGRGAHHRLHRRAAHDGRGRQGRGRHRRGQHAQARARPGRAALRGRHDARRVPQVHREGRRARAPLPEGAGGRAERRVHDRDPARPAGEVRGPPRRGHHRPGHRRRRRALAPLHHGPLPARQGHRPHRRGGRPHQDGDRLQARGDGQARPAPHPAEDRARGGEAGEGRGLEEAPRAAGERDREARDANTRTSRRSGARRSTRCMAPPPSRRRSRS